MTQGNPLPTLTATQARELEGHRWTIEGQALRFANRDPSYPGSVPFRQGSEGIAYPLLDGTGQPGVYAKFFHKTSVTRKRVQRAQWLVNQRVDTWAQTLIGAPYCWANTQDTGRPEGIGFDFTCSLAVATPGMTWQEVKLGIADGDIQLAPEFRERCAKDLIRALAKLEQSDFMHGDLSDGNVMVDINAPDGTPALCLIDFDAFVASGAGGIQSLSADEGGTFGTNGYCPPDLAMIAANDRALAVPYSDRFGRDVLLVELLCFDENNDAETPASQWDLTLVRKQLTSLQPASQLRHLDSDSVFQCPEERRPASCQLANDLGLPTGPVVNVQIQRPRVPVAARVPSSFLPAAEDWIRPMIFMLWTLCASHWTLLCLWGADWIMRAAAVASQARSPLLPALAEAFLACVMSSAGVVALATLAFADKRPQVVSLWGLGIQLPARRNWRLSEKQHQRQVAVKLAGTLVILALIVFLSAKQS